jgi:hypothetical protein
MLSSCHSASARQINPKISSFDSSGACGSGRHEQRNDGFIY